MWERETEGEIEAVTEMSVSTHRGIFCEIPGISIPKLSRTLYMPFVQQYIWCKFECLISLRILVLQHFHQNFTRFDFLNIQVPQFIMPFVFENLFVFLDISENLASREKRSYSVRHVNFLLSFHIFRDLTNQRHN